MLTFIRCEWFTLSVLSNLSKDYDFWCSVNLRKRKSKTLVYKEKGIDSSHRKNYMSDVPSGDGSKIGRDVNNPSHENKMVNLRQSGGKRFIEYKKELEQRKDKTPFTPPPLKYYEKYYIRIEPKSKEWIRNLYVGDKEKVKDILNIVFPEIDWDEKNEKYIRDNLREVYSIIKTKPQHFSIGVLSFLLSQESIFLRFKFSSRDSHLRGNIILQSHQILYAHPGYQNPHPFFERLGSLMVDHKSRVRYLQEIHEDSNNY